MNTSEINEFEKDFTNYTDKTLKDELELLPQGQMSVQMFLNRTETILKSNILNHSPTIDFLDLNEVQKEAYKKAFMEQVIYVLNSGDYSIIAGYDAVSNTIVDNRLLNKRIISPIAILILTNGGLYYRGMRRHCSSSYMDERSTWK